MGKRSGAFLVLGLMLLPAAAWAQKPSGNVWTRSAEVYLDQALKANNAVDKTRFFKEATDQITLAMQKDPNNPFAWQLAGKTYIAMGDAAKADSMFDRAETLYAPYVPVDAPFREQGWIDAYNNGVRALQANKMDDAIRYLRTADMIFQGRPSARMTLASIYLNRQEYDNAIEEYKGALAILRGPNGKNLKPDQQKQWDENTARTTERLVLLYKFTKKYGDAVSLLQQQLAANPTDAGLKLELATNIALAGNEADAKKMFLELAAMPNLSDDQYFETGVALFRARLFPDAAASFRKAAAANPFNHGALYNLSNALLAQTQPIEEAREKAAPAARKPFAQQLAPLFNELSDVTARFLALEPANSMMIRLASATSRGLADIATDPKAEAAGKEATLKMLLRGDSLRFEVSDAAMTVADDGAKLTGTITNKRVTAGSPITFKVYFLAKDGSTVEAQDVSVPAPTKEQTVDFTATTKSKDAVGWKYELGR